jgi:regulator of sigma E protease
MTILSGIYVVVAMVLLFGAAVFMHEFGHYWVARRRGLKVEAFSIGFGPKIIGWVKDGIEYSWRWIPAGGYVKLPQMVTSEMIEGGNATVVPPAPPLSKILVAFAGPFMNVVFAFIIAGLIYVVGLPELVNPPIIGYVAPDSPEAKLGIQQGDRILAVNGKAINSWQDVQRLAIVARTNIFPVVIEHDGKESTYQLATVVNEQLGLKMLNLDPRDHPLVHSVESGGPAAKAGLKVDDEFVSFAGVSIYSQDQLVELIRKRPGQASQVVVKRGDEKLSLSVTPLFDPKTQRGRIGVGLIPSAKTVYMVRRPGPLPWDSVWDAWAKTWDTVSALFHSKQTGVGVKDLSGPPGILAMLAAQIKTDYRLALSFLVLLNVNLAIINLLPLPVLDGGHIVMSIIEAVRRRPLSVRVVEYVNTAFALLLITFMVYVSFNDVKRFRLFKSMFQHETQIESSSQKADAPPAVVAPEPAK